MAVVHEHDDGDGGSSAAVVAIFLIALIVILAILFYGFAVAHWFGVGAAGNTTIINPPSTTMACPVMYDERADSSHSAVSATSGAVPGRPSAIFLTTPE